MSFSNTPQRFVLLRPQMLRFPADSLGPIECLEGTLWITQDGHPQDVVLEPGQHWHPSDSAAVIVSVLSDKACLAMREGGSGARLAAPWSVQLRAA